MLGEIPVEGTGTVVSELEGRVTPVAETLPAGLTNPVELETGYGGEAVGANAEEIDADVSKPGVVDRPVPIGDVPKLPVVPLNKVAFDVG